MAGDWIKMREALHEDPAVLAMANGLATRPEHVVGYCHRFWSWVSRNCHDGTVTGVTIEALESVINLPGFLSMMCQVGWLEYRVENGKPLIVIPKFDRHLSQGAKNRALSAERQRAARNGDVTEMSRKQRDETVTREEKIREENTSTPLPPPPSVSNGAASTGVDAEWEGVVVALHGEGVARSRSAARKARDAGCMPETVLDALAHYRSKKPAWTPGALHDRIVELTPDQDVTLLWPPIAKAPPDTSADRERVAATFEAKRQADAAKLAEDDARYAALNAEHGAELDRMDRDRIRELAKACMTPAVAEFETKRIPKLPLPRGTLREALLEQLHSLATF